MFFHFPYLLLNERERDSVKTAPEASGWLYSCSSCKTAARFPSKCTVEKKEQEIYCANSSPSPPHTHAYAWWHMVRKKQLATLLNCTGIRLKAHSTCFHNDSAVIRCTSEFAEMIPMIYSAVSRVAELDCSVREEEICVGVGPFVSGGGA